MIKDIFFQSSLPRSGSTLLQNIMGQNPKFHVTPTSGVLELLFAARHNYTDSLEFKAQDAEEMQQGFQGFCRGGIEGFYNSVTDKPYVLDKSRGWGYYQDFLHFFYPDPKIVCMVRDPRSIFSSMEKNHRSSQEKNDGIVLDGDMSGITVEQRIDTWVRSQPVGLAFDRLKDIILKGNDEYIHFIKFEDLCAEPEREIHDLYDYLEVKQYEHDFNNIKQITKEDDSVYGIYGDHNIKNQIEELPKDYNTILGKDASDWIANNYNWLMDRFGY